jgi:class 3 adenylate cyclase/tetratricopeptide (TPR) repeat protein
LAAIVSADIAGYSRLMSLDESGTLAELKRHTREVIEPNVGEYGGRIVKTTGDGFLIEFPSVVDAVRCAVEVQRGVAKAGTSVSPDQRIAFRIGINVGDVIIDAGDIYGDGVNVAARLQALADPGGICVSKAVRDHVVDKLSCGFDDLGPQRVKNIPRAIEAYRVRLGDAALPQVATPARFAALPRWPWVVAGVAALALVAIGLSRISPASKEAPPSPPAFSVAVMPLAAPTGDVEAARFAEALTRSLVTQLGQTSGRSGRLQVVSASRSAQFATGDARAALHVRYVVDGDVLHGEHYAVNLRLLDATSGGQVWSERDVLQESDVLSESSANLHNISVRLRSGLAGSETRRVMALPVSALSPTDLVVRAIATLDRDPSLAGVKQARALIDDALRRAPELEPALTAAATILDYEIDVDPAADRVRIVREMDAFTRRAIALDPADPYAWHTRGIVLVYLGRSDAALEANGRRIKLAPQDPSGYVARAWILNMSGKPEEALPYIDRALAMNPPDVAFALRIGCEVQLLAGRAAEAIAWCEKATGTDPYWFTHLFLAAAYANDGQSDKAAAARAEILRIAPGYAIAQLRAKRYSDNPEYQRRAEQYWYGGLRKAGIPEQ